jgi:hypothetical protein
MRLVAVEGLLLLRQPVEQLHRLLQIKLHSRLLVGHGLPNLMPQRPSPIVLVAAGESGGLRCKLTRLKVIDFFTQRRPSARTSKLLERAPSQNERRKLLAEPILHVKAKKPL